MARPALVIGLGGTGQWVLTYLKKDLIESNNGQMPDTVRLLAFDTMPQATAEVAATGGRRGEKEVRVGSIKLETDVEFVHLGGDVYELEQVVAQGKLPHIGSWFRADNWLANLPRAAHVLSAGAGQLRQFGRIALFEDLTSTIESEVWSRLDVAIGQLRQKLAGDQRLEIIIAGSFAGGTGSGMFIDMALLARHRAKKVPNLIRGYFVLPRAFDPDADDDMLARSFAAWRELNRFMVVSPDFALPSLIYNSQEGALQLREIKSKVFDACYLVDGVRGGARVAANAEMGVHPTVADAISALLDDIAGTAYTEWVVQNLAPTYATNPGTPLYSVVGTHTFKVPVYYAQQDFAHRLTLNWLDLLLKPIRDDPQNPERVTRVDATSPYEPTNTGRDEALSLLQSGQEYEGRSEVPTLFSGRIANIVMEGGATSGDLVDQHVRGSFGQRRGRGFSWLGDYTNLGDRADIQDLIQRVRREAGLRVTDAVKPGKEIKVSPKDWPRYVERTLPAWLRERYGFRTASGEEHRGKFGEALDECGQAQLDIFRRLVKLWLLRTLMGGDKSGRLGYAYDLLDGLVIHLDEFLEFMDKVRAKREEANPRLQAERDRNRKWEMVQEFARKKFLIFFDHPRANTAQVAYLQAEQALAAVRKDELLHGAVVETARAMKAYCADMREELDRWIRALAVGDPATGVQGLYPLLNRQRRQIEQTRAADERLTAVQTRVGELVYPAEQQRDEVARLMDGVKWRIEDEANSIELKFSIEPPGEPAAQLDRPVGTERTELREHLTQRNLDRLQQYAARRFSHLPEDTRIVERLRQEYGTAETFLGVVGDRAEPLFDKQPGVEGGPAKWSELIRISTGDVDADTLAFIQGRKNERGEFVELGVVQERRKKRGLNPDARDQDKLVEAVGSADPHKCTFVRTGDLLSAELFRAWHDCRDAYLRNRKMPPHLNHNFPAEANAADYEFRYAEKQRRVYRVFHPWVVMLLEHPKRLDQFFLCWAMEWIRVKIEGAHSWYELETPNFHERYDRAFRLTPPSESLWSPFQAAKAFVLEGLDQTPQSAWMLDYEVIRDELERSEGEMGAGIWLAFLEEQTASREDNSSPADERLVTRWLRYHIKELDSLRRQGKALPAGEPADYTQAYTDLADVAQLMIEERLDRKQVQLGRQAQSRPTPPPPRPLPETKEDAHSEE